MNDAIDAPIVPRMLSIEGLPLNKPPFGRITALDLNKGTMAWQVAHGETPDFIQQPSPAEGREDSAHRPVGLSGTLATKTAIRN